MKKFFAEVIGTFMLVFIGTGAVVFGNGTEGLGHLGIALAFGLSIVAAAYSIGTVSGAHLNPAVSIAMFVNKRLSSKDLVNYIAAQVVGAVLASATVLFLLSNSGMSTASLGENALAKGVTPFGGFLFEVIASFIFILVIMTVTSASKGNGKIAGLVIDWYADFMKAYTEMLPAGSSDIDLDPAEMKSSLADILDEVDNLKFKLSFALNVKSADIMLFEGEMTGESDEGKAKAEVTVDFGKNPAESDSFDAKMKLTDVDGQEISAKATVKRTNDKDSFERKISLSAESDGESHSLEIGFKHDKESKNFSFCYTMDDEKAEVNGTLEYSDNDLSLVVEKIIINGEETVLGIKLFVKAGEEVPAMPDFKNLATMSKDDYTALGESVQQNVLPILNALGIPGLGSSGGHHTINPDYDYDDEDPYDIYRNFDNTYDYDEDGDTGDDDDYAVWEYMNSLLFGDGDDDFDWDSYIGD